MSNKEITINQTTNQIEACADCQRGRCDLCGRCWCCYDKGRRNSQFLTTVTDPSGAIHLGQWFSLNDRPARERRQVAADLGTVILRELCKPAG